MRSLVDVPAHITDKLLPRICVQSLLAVDLCLRTKNDALYTAWRSLLPSMSDFRASLPFFWPAELQECLPSAAKAILVRQQEKVAREWPEVHDVFPAVDKDTFAHAWFTIGTRTFYWEAPELDTYEWEDHLAVVPLADFFNHADQVGSKVAYDSNGYSIVTNRKYKAGDEICISYGGHSNDFLLTEYGFILPENQYDKLCLDDILLPQLSESEIKALRLKDSWQGYVLTPNGRCDRTEAMLDMLCRPKDRSKHATSQRGVRGGRKRREQLDTFFAGLVKDFLVEIRDAIARIEASKVGRPSQRDLLRRRWAQMETLVVQSLGSAEVRPLDSPPSS